MDNVQKQRGNVVLYKEQKDGTDYIRVEYAENGEISLLLSQDKAVEMAGNGSAYITAETFKLSDFYDRYSPYAYIDYSRVYVRHPKPTREYTLPEGYLELLEQKRYSPSTIKTYRAYFSDFMEYHKGRNIDRLKVADINRSESGRHQQVHSLPRERKENFRITTEYAHQRHQVLLRASERRKTAILRWHYTGKRV